MLTIKLELQDDTPIEFSHAIINHFLYELKGSESETALRQALCMLHEVAQHIDVTVDTLREINEI